VLDRADPGLRRLNPGFPEGLQVNVDDIETARAFLQGRGVDVSDVEAYPWGRFCFFADPDGNTWSVHEPVERG